jgi:hypothetical protein
MKKRMSVVILLVFLLFLALTSSALAETYYVNAESGDNLNNGKSPEKAWKTCNKIGPQSRVGTFKPGDSILFASGQVFPKCSITFVSSGTEEEPIFVSSYGGGSKPELNGDTTLRNVWTAARESKYVTLQNLKFTKGIYGIYLGYARTKEPYGQISGQNYHIVDSEISHNIASGIRIFGGDKVSITNNDIHNNIELIGIVHAGIYIDSPLGQELVDITIDGNNIFDNDAPIGDTLYGDGIRLSNGGREPTYQKLRISNNRIYDNGREDQNKFGRGITGSYCGDVEIRGNEIFSNAATGIAASATSTGCEESIKIMIVDNIFFNHPTRHASCGPRYTGDLCGYYHNTFIQQAGQDRISYNIQTYSSSCPRPGSCQGTVDIQNNIFYSDFTEAKCSSESGTRSEFLSDNGLSQGKTVETFISDYNLFFTNNNPSCRDFSSKSEGCDFACWNEKGYDIHATYMVDPLFVEYNPLNSNFNAHNFRLQESSAAIDSGVVIPTVNDNFFGSYPDIGSVEYGDSGELEVVAKSAEEKALMEAIIIALKGDDVTFSRVAAIEKAVREYLEIAG